MSTKQLKKLDAGQIQKIIDQLEQAQQYLKREDSHIGSPHMKVGYAQGTCDRLLSQLKGEWPL